MSKFPFYKQADLKDCGPTCLKIIIAHYDKVISIDKLRKLSENTREGSSLLGLSDASEKLGFKAIGARLSLESLREMTLPCILHWNKNHYVVLYKISNNTYHISDPAHGLLKYTEEEFLEHWIGNNAVKDTEEGIALLLEPTPVFLDMDFEEDEDSTSFTFLAKYIFKYRSFLWQLVIGLMAASLLQLIFPFLTQSVIDVGIRNNDINFVYLILFAQLGLFIGRTAIEVIRGWILLHLSTRINITLVSDFFIKLMNLPISFFDTRMTGDILQRINDHRRIERIMTTSSLSVIFSMVNLIVFSIVLCYYSIFIFGIFFIGSFLYFLWIVVFLKKRKKLDYKMFSQVSQEQSKVIELINGMQEIKLHNAEKQKRWSWEYLQARLFKISIEGLVLEQYQSVGSGFLNEVKNILITVFSAKLVVQGDITLGMMLAISYIVGQLNSPIARLINFVRELQDAKISLDRLSEIHRKEDEKQRDREKTIEIPKNAAFSLQDISYRYVGAEEMVLKNLGLTIPANKITAIVGTSGSGKTTLMKLLLKFYEPRKGNIMLGNLNLNEISQEIWRDKCGVVMQEGYIFDDTLANNIAVGEDFVNKEKLDHAMDVANINEFVKDLPQHVNTKIGMQGMGLSTGQKQRLLIARAIYKNPDYLFMDEATSSLDANNEKDIMEKLNRFFINKTVVVIAHRLSTVKNADQILVLENGQITETGNHESLVEQKGKYYNLIKNQLELGD